MSLLVTSIIYPAALALAIWMAGAIYFDVLRSSKWGVVLATLWVTLVGVMLTCWQPIWKPFVLFFALSSAFLWWWFSQKPSHNREWDPNFALLSRVELTGDAIRVENVRNTEYRTIDDYSTHFETREYRLSQLRGVDALMLYWGSKWMCHPMFVFDFGPDGRLCISIEVRYRKGQIYSLLSTFYRQQELMYVVCDERDAILRRTRHLSGHDLYLYRLLQTEIAMKDFFLEYAASINAIADSPRWYHGLTTNCTTSIYLQSRGRIPWDWRMLFNGELDRMLYDYGILDHHLSFEVLKKQSWINDLANSAPVGGFGNFIRDRLPGYRTSLDGELTTSRGARTT